MQIGPSPPPGGMSCKLLHDSKPDLRVSKEPGFGIPSLFCYSVSTGEGVRKYDNQEGGATVPTVPSFPIAALAINMSIAMIPRSEDWAFS